MSESAAFSNISMIANVILILCNSSRNRKLTSSLGSSYQFTVNPVNSISAVSLTCIWDTQHVPVTHYFHIGIISSIFLETGLSTR